MKTLSAEQDARAVTLHREALIIDTLSGEPSVFSPAMLSRLEALVARQAPTADILSEMDRMATHSFSRELSPHDRGKTDDIMRALAERDGYFGVLVVPFFITPEPRATLAHFMAHVDRVVEVMGIDHVGIGTDWGAVFPKSLEALMDAEMIRFGFRPEHRTSWGARVDDYPSWCDWPNITRALVGRGYSDNEIIKLLGANFLRIFRDVVG